MRCARGFTSLAHPLLLAGGALLLAINASGAAAQDEVCFTTLGPTDAHDSVRLVRADGSREQRLFTGETHALDAPQDLAIIGETATLFCIDSGALNTIKTAPATDVADFKIIVALDDVSAITGLSLDRASETIYFTTNGPDRIMRVKFNGTELVTLYDEGDLDNPHDIVVDMPDGTIFFADNDAIRSARIDGAGPINTLVTHTGLRIRGIALDNVRQMLYYTTAGDLPDSDSVRRIAYDGTDRMILYSEADGLVEPLDVEVDLATGALYIADGTGTGRIHRASSTGTGELNTVSVQDSEITVSGITFVRGGVNQAPVIDVNEEAMVTRDGQVVITTDLLHAFDPEGRELTFTVNSIPECGRLLLNGVELMVFGMFTIEDLENGNLVYEHDGSECTEDSFEFDASDGFLKDFDVFRIAIDEPSNMPPVLTIFDNAVTYRENADPVAVAAGATVTDDGVDLGGGVIEAAIIENLTENDRLTLLEFNGLTIDGTNVRLNGTAVGTLDINVLAGTLRVDLNANVPFDTVETILGAIAFFNVSEKPSERTRQVALSVSDGDLSDNGLVDVMVVAINDAPINAVPAGVTLDEDASATDISGLSISDVDVDNDVQQLRVTLTSERPGIAIISTGVTEVEVTASRIVLQGTINALNASLATATYTPAPNSNGSFNITLLTDDQANVGEGNTLTDTDLIPITVNPINDAPTLGLPDARTTAEDTAIAFGPGAGAFSVNDIDSGSGDLQLTLTATNGTLTSTNITGVILQGNNSETLTLTGPRSNLFGLLFGQGITFNPTPDYNGSATIDAVLSDLGNTGAGGPLTDAGTVQISIEPVNDPPSFTLSPDDTVVEDSGSRIASNFATNISAGPANESSQTVSFEILTNDNAALFAVQPLLSNDGTLTYTPAANATGSATLTVILRDNGGSNNESAIMTFQIHVLPENDGPINTVPGPMDVDEDGELHCGPETNTISIADIDSGERDISVTISATNGILVATGSDDISLTGSGTSMLHYVGTRDAINAVLLGNGLTYRPTADYNGDATITVTTDDQGATGEGGARTDTDTIDVTVHPINDQPSFAATSGVSILEDAGAQSTSAVITSILTGPANEAGQSVSFTVLNNSNAGLFEVAPAIAADGHPDLHPSARCIWFCDHRRCHA